jgi:hypothetical protein
MQPPIQLRRQQQAINNIRRIKYPVQMNRVFVYCAIYTSQVGGTISTTTRLARERTFRTVMGIDTSFY